MANDTIVTCSFLAVLLLCADVPRAEQTSVIAQTNVSQDFLEREEWRNEGRLDLYEPSAPDPTTETSSIRPFSGSSFDPALPVGLDGRVGFHYSAMWAPQSSVEDQSTELGYVRQNSGISFPLWFGERQSLFASVNLQNLMFQTDAVLPDAGLRFPDNLWDIRGTLVHSYRFSNDWSTTVIGSLGSTGDRPFAGSRELIAGVTSVLTIPSGERNAWLASLSYQPVTGLPFPIPGVAYLYSPTNRFAAQIGIPFRMHWDIQERLHFDASYLPVTNVRAYLTYDLCRDVELFGGFDWVTESFFLYDRVRYDDFFNLLEKRIPVGIRWSVAEHWIFDAQTGYLFDRVFFTGDSILDQSSDIVRVRPSVFLMLRMMYCF